MYLSAYQATQKVGVSSDTFRRWHKQGEIAAKTSPSGIRLCDVSSLLPELTYENDGAPPRLPLPPLPPREGISTRAYHVPNKKKTSSDRRNSSSPDSQLTSSSVISAPVSTSNPQSLRPYWNAQAEELSRRLWLPTEISFAVSPS